MHGGVQAVTERVLLVAAAGEIALKSERTRPRFERRLLANLEDAFRRNSVPVERMEMVDGRVVVWTRELEKALHTALHVFGVHGATVAYRLEYEGLEDLARRVEEVAADWVKGRRFAVRARRAHVTGFTSLDVAREVGARLKPYSAGVDLENPEVEVHVEVRGREAYVHTGFERGPGGLPTGVEGRALALFSGGIDSPVAAWMTAKRGVEVDLLHFILADPRSLAEALEVASYLASRWLYGYKPRLYAVDFRVVTAAIAARVRRDYAQVVLRLAMYVYASRLAAKHGYQALVTGESVGQVSTQTLGNLYAISLVASKHMPVPLVLRPLAGMDKEEVVALARRIGTYELSARVKEYCRIASEGSVATRSDPKPLEEEVSKIMDVVDHASVVAVHELA